MQLSIRTWKNRTFTLHVEQSDVIKNVKAKIQEREGFLPGKYSLIFNENQLEEDGRTLSDFNVQQESELVMRKRRLRDRVGNLEHRMDNLEHRMENLETSLANILQKLELLINPSSSRSGSRSHGSGLP